MTVVVRSAFTPYSAAQMYALVNDVPAYPEFLPWCVAADVLDASEAEMRARLKVQRGRFDHAFTTANKLLPQRRIELHLLEGPFRRFSGAWTFTPADGGCLIKFDVEFEFTSRILGLALTTAFKPIANSLVDAFKNRAHTVYGQAS